LTVEALKGAGYCCWNGPSAFATSALACVRHAVVAAEVDELLAPLAPLAPLATELDAALLQPAASSAAAAVRHAPKRAAWRR
jgi:hypothetical protein